MNILNYILDGIDKEIGVSTPPFSKVEPGISQRPDSRPGTSEAAMRVIMNPLIKSTSPRFKINSRFNQMAGQPSNLVKQDYILGGGAGAIRPREDLLQQKSRDSKEIYFGKDSSKEDINDLSESVESKEEVTKKKQIPRGNEIRIRPVSAHILKGVSNNLGQIQDEKAGKNIKPSGDKIEKGSENTVSSNSNSNNKIPTAKPMENYIPIKTDGDASRGAAALRPKSAVFAGRINGAGMHFNREQADNALRNLKDSEQLQSRGVRSRQIMGGFATIENEKRLSMYDRQKIKNNDRNPTKHSYLLICKLVTASREEAEEGDMLNGPEKKLMSMYGGFFQSNNFMRFEFLGKGTAKNSVEVVKKTDPGDEWENKIAEIKGLREPSGRPMTSTGQKKRLTIHDLK